MAVANPLVPVLLSSTNEAAIGAHIAKQVRNYPIHQQQLARFLVNYSSSENQNGVHGNNKYLNQLQDIVDHKSTVVKLYLDDLREYFQSNGDDTNIDKLDPGLPFAFERNCLRYLRLSYEAVEEVKKTLIRSTPTETENHCSENGANYGGTTDYLQGVPGRGLGKLDVMEAAKVPIYLRAPYEIRLIPSMDSKRLSVREVRAPHIGALILMDGIVTKVSNVKPRLLVAYYKCLDCGADAHQPIESPNFMPLAYCQSSSCVANQKKGELRMILPESKFVKYQEVRIQEPPNRVPAGSIPRTQKIIVEGSLTRRLVPGMLTTLAGIPTPTPKTGFQSLSSGSLLTESTFLVTDIEIHKQEDFFETSLTDTTSPTTNYTSKAQELFERYENDPDLYEKLAHSIAPSIHGLDDVKKTLLLQLVGGVTETFSDGMKLRGDIHILLMGDPGVAKSQLLGQICRIAPRAHYTTGKGSSGVGLTACVVRDGTTGDFTLEGGAIVLSDRGICCIDEFDKMDEYDRTAIHEVMEQQTVSISKAGLTTTLNARTSILAAANPQYGRYDIKKSPMQNINLPAALLSRFDVQFLLLDRADRDADINLARHVLRVHQMVGTGKSTTEKNKENFNYEEREVLPASTIRLLIAKAKQFKPKLPQSLMREIVEYYVDLRQRERTAQLRNEFTSYTTPRTLFAVLRLTQALARLRFSNIVGRGDFEEALRLVYESKRSIAAEELNRRHKRSPADTQTAIIEMLKEMDAKYAARDIEWDGWLVLTEVEDISTRNGFDRGTLMKTLDAYEELDVIQWDTNSRNRLAFTERLMQ